MLIQTCHEPWPKIEEVNLEQTLNELEIWRSQKEGYGARIPEQLYMKIVVLSQKYSPGKICALFSISGAQLKNKIKYFEKIGYLDSSQEMDPSKVDFQEVKPSAPNLKKEQISNLMKSKENNVAFPENARNPKLKLDRTTMVVEFFHGNHKMAIHITQENLPELIDAFYSRSI